MKIGTALLLVMSKWKITIYRLGKDSGVGQATVGKLVRGEISTTSWDNTEKLIYGLKLTDPMAAGGFVELLRTPEEQYPLGLYPPEQPEMEEREYPSNITEVILAMQELGYIDGETIATMHESRWRNAPAKIYPSVAQVISMKMQEMRKSEDESYESKC